ncbi:MAG: glycoside hydrolase family 76 protein [Clostridiales bacterium]|jgi:predicted alpha-1,6-mannanase (GH76 family)|nr:glycoside hydrolase family 76 protein [Clostridiales bacterium]
MNNRTNAEEIINLIIEKFWDKGEDFLLEMYPPKPGAEKYSFLWGYGAYMTLLGTYVKNTGDQEKLRLLLKANEKLELYKAVGAGPAHYNSHPDKYGAGEPYYDDNAWVILALLQTHELTRDAKFLARAVAAAEYLYGGESEKIGGILWKEHNCETANTCCCGPAVVCGALLYGATGDKKYLGRAVKLYDWTVKTLSDADGVFFDSINGKGEIDRRKYTYNTGTMIWGGAKLYGLTGDARYLNNAAKSARGAMEHFMSSDASGFESLPATPWFHVYLLQGLIELDKHKDARNFIERINAVLSRAAETGRTAENLYYPEWRPVASAPPYYHQGLDSMGTAECFSLLIPYDGKI